MNSQTNAHDCCAAVSTQECMICYEPFDKKNIAITPCAHTYCFQCILKALSINRNCPICREDLMEEDVYNNFHPEEAFEYETESDVSGDSDDSDDTEYESVSSDVEQTSDEADSEEDDIPVPDISDFHIRLEKKGYNMLDVMSLFMDERSKLQTRSHYKQLKKDYDEIYEEVCNEFEENYFFGKEDKNALYMEVVSPSAIPPISESCAQKSCCVP